MTFAITNQSATQSTLTQSGTDTAWSGIETAVNAIVLVARSTLYAVGSYVRPPVSNGFLYRCTTAGTSDATAPTFATTAGALTTDGTAVFFAFVAPFITANGDRKTYHCPTYNFQGEGTLTIANPMLETLTCRLWGSIATFNYTSGSFMLDGVTPKFDGIHFTTALKGTNDFSEVSTWAGRWNVRGGVIQLAASVKPDGGLPQIFTAVTFTSSALWARSIRFRSYSTALEFRNECRFYNIALDAFRIPPVTSVKGFASEYVSEYVGSSAGGIDAKMTIFALSNQDGYAFDFDNYGGGFVEIYNCAKGAALDVRSLNNSPRHCVPLFQQLNFKVTNLSGAARDGVRFVCTDAPTNSPTATISPIGPDNKIWDFRNPQVYTGITAGGGLASSVPVLKVWHGNTNIQNLRFPASTAVYRLAGYNVIQQDVSVVLGSDTAQTVAVAMTAATNLILSEAQAAALTGIALVASGAGGGTITLTVPRTISELWQYFRAWKPLNLASNEWTYDGTTLNVLNWTVIGVNNLSVGEIQTSTASATGVIANLIVIGNVTQAAPTNLSNVTITGTLTYNATAATPVTFTNVIAGIVTNSGAESVTVKRFNATLITGANVTAFVPTVITLTLGGGRIRILDNSETEQYNQTADASVELPASASGNWSYRITKYGSNQIVGGFTVDGTTKTIVASYIPDLNVVDTQINSQAYTDLDSSQKLYDYLAHHATTPTGIIDGAPVSKGFGTFTALAGLTLDQGALSLITVAAGVVTAKSSGFSESVTLLSARNILAPILSNVVKLRALNFDSELIYSATSLTLFATQPDRDAGTNAGQTLTGGVYRFKHNSIVAGVTLSGTVYARASVGATTFFTDLVIVPGQNVIDLGIQAQLTAIASEGVANTNAIIGNIWAAS